MRNIASLPFLTLILGVSFAAPSVAEPPPLQARAAYAFRWSGIDFGHCVVDANQKDGHYRITADIKSTGIAKFLSAHQSKTVVEGQGTPSADAERVYETNYSTRGKQKHVKLTYAQGGSLKDSLVEPPEAEGKRSPIAPEQLKGVADPLTFIAELRNHMQHAREEGKAQVRLPVFDGRRLYDTSWNIVGETSLTLNGKNQQVIRVNATRKLIAGYTQKELAQSKDDPAMTAYFTTDTNLPVKMEISLMIGSLEAVLEPMDRP